MNAIASGGDRHSNIVETTILGASSNSAERSFRLFLYVKVTWWFYKVHCTIGHTFQASSQRFCQHLYDFTKPQLELYNMRCWLFCVSIIVNNFKRWRGIFLKGSHRMEEGRNYLEFSAPRYFMKTYRTTPPLSRSKSMDNIFKNRTVVWVLYVEG
jgi:hypothetical protein